MMLMHNLFILLAIQYLGVTCLHLLQKYAIFHSLFKRLPDNLSVEKYIFQTICFIYTYFIVGKL